MTKRAIGSHQSTSPKSVIWLTPRPIIEALGPFDLDPCAAPLPRPWSTAAHMNTREMANGLLIRWWGRVWLNPPYTASEIGRWLRRLADHGRGTALIFARTETDAFRREVWERAHGLLFLHGRLNFHRNVAPDPDRCERRPHDYVEFMPDSYACRWCGRSKKNAGAPSVLVAYGQDDLDRLAAANLAGSLVPLRLARLIVVEAITGTWAEEISAWLAEQSGPVSVSDAYRHFARHPKARGNRHVRAKVRQQLQRVAVRVEKGTYQCARLPGL